jgi:hypothetical protein
MTKATVMAEDTGEMAKASGMAEATEMVEASVMARAY